MKRVVVGGFHHESNSLSSMVSGEKDFLVRRGEDLLIPQDNTSLTGIIETLKMQGYEVLPTLHMRGVPHGEVDKDFFLKVFQEFLERVEAQEPFDAFCLALHGSMRVKDLGEAEGFLLKTLKEKYPLIPIYSSLDMHATMSEDMLKNGDGFAGYKTAPHIDCTETGVLAAEMTCEYLSTGIKPSMQWIKLPILIAGEKSGTDVYPMTYLIEQLKKAQGEEGILSASYLLGFPWSDNKDAGVNVLVMSRGEEKYLEKGKAISRELSDAFWMKRREFSFVTESYAVEESLEKALEYVKEKETPVYLSDSGDNPTAGGTADQTELLHALLNSELLEYTRPAYAGLYDPVSVKKCIGHEGEELLLSLGGVYDTSFSPVEITSKVLAVKDYTYSGLKGKVVLLDANGIDLIIAENHIGFTEADLFRLFDIEPSKREVLITKLGYLTPSHEEVAEKSILVLTKGATNEDLLSIPYKDIPRPMFPLDEMEDSFEPDLTNL